MNRQGGNHRPNGHETHNGHDRRDAHGEGHDHEGQGHHEGHEAIARLEHEIDDIRNNLGGLVGELDRRRRRAFNFRLQLRENTVPMIVGGVVLLGLVGGAIALVVSRRRRARSLSVRARAFVARARGVRQAVRRAAVHPERVARAGKNGVVDERNFMQRIVEAGALAGAGMAGRQLATRAFKP